VYLKEFEMASTNDIALAFENGEVEQIYIYRVPGSGFTHWLTIPLSYLHSSAVPVTKKSLRQKEQKPLSHNILLLCSTNEQPCWGKSDSAAVLTEGSEVESSAHSFDDKRKSEQSQMSKPIRSDIKNVLYIVWSCSVQIKSNVIGHIYMVSRC
jgi:hypothetical protein